MDSAQLLTYLSGFPRMMLYAIIPFFLPMQKKRNWYVYLPLPLALLTACVGLGMLVFPRLPLSELVGPLFFGLHYILVFASLSLSLCLICASSWEESLYAVLCAYMAQHLSYCLDTLAEHFWSSSPASGFVPFPGPRRLPPAFSTRSITKASRVPLLPPRFFTPQRPARMRSSGS